MLHPLLARTMGARSTRDPMWLRYGLVVVAAWVVLLMCAAARGQTTGLWTRLSPSSRVGTAMAYDSARHVVVLFGGGNQNQNDTWEWDGAAWTQVYSGGPPARQYHSMAFDSLRGVTVMFGGETASGSKLRDTWEWDGQTWRPVATTGPAARSRSAMAFDSLRGVTVMFSGEMTDIPNRTPDTWEWDGVAWTQRQPAVSPPGTHSHSLAYDSARGVTVLTGGLWLATGGALSGTWEWNGTTWTRRGEDGSGWGYSMAFDSARGVSIRNGSKWSGTAWTALTGTTPRPDSGVWSGGAAFDSARGVLVLAGGATADGALRTWEWNGAQWVERTPKSPWARQDHAMAFDSTRGAAVMFGGMGLSVAFSTPFADTWEWRGGSWVQRLDVASNSPPASVGSAMVFDRAWGVARLFGGRDAQGHGMARTWEFSGAGWTERIVAGPSPRAWHAMAYDSDRGVTVLFGGRTDLQGSLGDTWEWNGWEWALKATGGPDPRAQHVMAYDSARHVTVLFGGNTLFGLSTRFGDTWEWDGATWTKRASTGPSPRTGASMAFDPWRGVCVLNGGHSATADLGDTWEWDGTAWTQVGTTVNGSFVPAAPGLRSGGAMVFDDARREMVMFGGSPGSSVTAETWLYRTDCIAPAFASSSTRTVRGCRGSTVTVTTAGSLGTGVRYAWYKGTSGLGNGPTGSGSVLSGSETTTLTIENARGSDTGAYVLRAVNSCGIADSATIVVRVCDADYDCSGTVAIDDVLAYLNAWLAEDPRADMDGGGLSVQDIFAFVNAWMAARTTAGCQ